VAGERWFWRNGAIAENVVANTITKGKDTQYRTHKYGAVVKPFPWLSVYYTDVKNLFPFLLAGTGSTASATNADKFALNDGLGAPFKDSEGTLKEYGVKIDRTLSETVSVYGSLVHFDMARTNVRTTGILPDTGVIGIIQSAKDTTEGWELDLGFAAKLANGRLDLKATYFDGSSTTAVDPTLEADGFVPTKYSLMGKYTWTGGPLRGLMFGGGVMDQDPKRNGTWEVDFPMIVNLFAGYQWGKHWSTQLNLDNVGDKYYLVAISNAGLSQTAETFRARLAVRYKW
jgi:outer membrane receptor protein involved in Fe transport